MEAMRMMDEANRDACRRTKPLMRVAILTISDTVSRGEREDLSGPALVQRAGNLAGK